MGTGDAVAAAALFAAAVWLLWRSLFRTRGGCPGCSAGCATGRSPAAADPGLVRLGRGAAAPHSTQRSTTTGR